MRRFWLSFWVMLTCLALSLPAWGGLLAPAACCPSQADMVAQIVEAAESGEALPDCCNDLSTYLQTGQACKTSSPIGAPLLGWPAGGASPANHSTARAAAACVSPSPPSAEPEGIWRPPL